MVVQPVCSSVIALWLRCSTPYSYSWISQVSNLRSQVALGEMASQFPIPGGQFALAGRFNSPELGFAMGVLFWYK